MPENAERDDAPTVDLDEVTETTAHSPSDLMDLDESVRGRDVHGSQDASWSFRGQPKTFGTLAPSFQREFGARKSVRTAEMIEQNLIAAFRDHYGTLHERSPNMPASSTIGFGFDMCCLSVMQHYGVPTRLLDWTTNFWHAVYFACSGDANEDGELWFYHRSIFDHQEHWRSGLGPLREPDAKLQSEPRVLQERGLDLVFELDLRLTPRMKTQFAHHTVSTEVFADHAPLIRALADNRGLIDAKPSFRRVIIDKGCKERTLRFLDEQMGVTASSIFPDVEGLGRFLRWQLDTLITRML